MEICQHPKEGSSEAWDTHVWPFWTIQNSQRCGNAAQFVEGLHHQDFIRSAEHITEECLLGIRIFTSYKLNTPCSPFWCFLPRS